MRLYPSFLISVSSSFFIKQLYCPLLDLYLFPFSSLSTFAQSMGLLSIIPFALLLSPLAIVSALSPPLPSPSPSLPPSSLPFHFTPLPSPQLHSTLLPFPLLLLYPFLFHRLPS